MSGIPSGIAGSVNQAGLQQSQVSRARDAKHNKTARDTREMQQLLQQHLKEVEDSSEANDERARIKEEESNARQQRRRRRQKEQQENESQAREFEDQVQLSSGQAEEKGEAGKMITNPIKQQIKRLDVQG